MDAKYKEVNIPEVPEWNWLSLDEHDPELFDEFNKMINDKIIPEADDEHKPHSQYGQNTEQTPEMFDSYVDK